MIINDYSDVGADCQDLIAENATMKDLTPRVSSYQGFLHEDKGGLSGSRVLPDIFILRRAQQYAIVHIGSLIIRPADKIAWSDYVFLDGGQRCIMLRWSWSSRGILALSWSLGNPYSGELAPPIGLCFLFS